MTRKRTDYRKRLTTRHLDQLLCTIPPLPQILLILAYLIQVKANIKCLINSVVYSLYFVVGLFCSKVFLRPDT